MPSVSAPDFAGVLDRLTNIGVALSAERDPAVLLDRILDGAMELTAADGGTLYLLKEGLLHMETLVNRSLDMRMGGASGEAVPFPPIALYDANGQPDHSMVVTHTALSRNVVNIPDAYHAEGYDFRGTRRFDDNTGYRSCSFLAVPMLDHENKLIGVLQLLNRQQQGATVAFSRLDQKLAESLASQAAIVLTQQQLIAGMKNLFDAFVRLIAGAIDEKSPYTGGHCRRVPVLAMMLADAASACVAGPMANFRMSVAEREELELAAWLHDCGKITTPEAVMDKATKLETIVDRIHWVETRIELLKRDVLLRWATGKSTPSLLAEFQADTDVAATEPWQELDEAWDLIGRANQGGEFMSDAACAKIDALAQRSWQDSQGKVQRLLSDEELMNLKIRKGTLNDAEREIIQNHVSVTIRMLQRLPFPDHLKRVPEIAGGHHERVDGRGYPQNLDKESLSIQARVLAIADVFEALTAPDRPYKKAMPLSRALSILGSMSDEGHIDPQLYAVFMGSGIPQRYAEEYLDAAQRDV